MKGVIKLGKQILKISIGQILLILIVIIAVVWGISAVKGNANPIEIENVTSNEENNSSFEDITATNENFSNTSEEENLLTENLDEDSLVYVTSVKDNGDDSYILSGIIYKKYTLTASEFKYAKEDGELTINGEVYSIQETGEENIYDLYLNDIPLYRISQLDDRNYVLEAQTEMPNCWKLTEETCKVLVEKDVKVEGSYGDLYTAEDIFGNMENSVPEDSTHPDSTITYRFEFSNDICINVIDVLTSA